MMQHSSGIHQLKFVGERKEKMTPKTLDLSKKAMPRNASSVRTVFPASRSSASYTHILQSQSGSVDPRSNTVMQSIRKSSLERSMSCLPAGCNSHAPLHFNESKRDIRDIIKETKKSVQCLSGASPSMKDKGCMSRLPAGCRSHTPLHFNESKRDARDIIKETKKSVQCLSGASPSMKDKGCMSRLPAGCRSHTPLHFNESKRDIRDIIKETKKSVQCLSGASPSMKDKGCMSPLPAGCRSHTPLHFNESKRDIRDIIKETKKSVQCLSGASPSMKDKCCMSRLPAGCRSHTPLHFNQSNRDIRDGIKGTKKSAQCPSGASPGMKDKSCKRKSLDRCDIRNCSEKSTPESSKNLHLVQRSDIGRASTSFSKVRNANAMRNNRHDLAREYVVEALSLYRDICRELSKEKSKAGKESSRIRNIDVRAAMELKQITGYVHAGMQFVGDVPGVEVGDTFYYRMELVVVGLHRPPRSGIDYMGSHPDILATSVVASWDYTDNLSKPDELVYVGQGGMPANDKKREDQKLTRGNLALVNSMNRNKPVRVIRKDRDHTFTYDGLYMVESCRKLRRANRQMVFEFLMKRIPGQPEIGQKKKKMKVVKSS